MPQKIVKVAVEKAGYSFDKLYSYIVPLRFEKRAVIGTRVMVPFGKGNSHSMGVIFEVGGDHDTPKIKPITDIVDEEEVLTENNVALAKRLKERTFCTYYDGIKVQLPTGLNRKIVAEYAMRTDAVDITEFSEELSGDERLVVRCLRNAGKPVKGSKLMEILGVSNDGILKSMVEKGYIKRTDEAIRNIGDSAVRVARICVDENELEDYFLRRATDRQKKVLAFLKDTETASLKEITYFTGVSAAIVKTMQKNGVVSIEEREVYRTPIQTMGAATEKIPDLTAEQSKVFEGLSQLWQEEKPNAALLYGITGSGKTQIYMHLISQAVNNGENCILLVPEIALTPQLVSRFTAVFGNEIALIHSGLSMGERLDEWKRIKRGQVKIAIGTRSCVFAPFDKVGLIIVDEEQETTYKSEMNPRYDAIDVAKYLVTRDNGLLLLGSATPSLESFYAAEKGRYKLFKLTERYGKAVLPEVIVSDMNTELKNGVVGSIGNVLAEEIADNLNKGEQTILLHNRRGYNTFVVCNECHSVFTCPNCSISMTYHSANGRLMCHYCGYSRDNTLKCKNCGEERNFRFSGSGTQKVYEELKEMFPDAKIGRMGADTVSGKYGYDKLLSDFANEKFDILLGTQMVAKGLDFPKVSLVGVILADQVFYADDYKAYERAFAMLTQVVGRSGRGEIKGRAVIQTFTPDNPVIELAKCQDYDSFAKDELAKRKALVYPPCCDICDVSFYGGNEERVSKGSKVFFSNLVRKYNEGYSDIPLKVLGPSPAAILKIGNKYHYRLMLKCRNDKKFRAFIRELLFEFTREKENRTVLVNVDINPPIIR